jgi:hypothetical protein
MKAGSARVVGQLVNIIGPDLVFRILAIDDDVGSTAVAPVEDYDAVAGLRHFAGEQLDAADIATAAGRERHPRAVVTEYFIIHVDTAYFC